MQRRVFLHSAATVAASAVMLAAGASRAHAQSRAPAGFPSRPIRLLIAFPAGSATDGVVRTLAGNAADILGQPVRVENLPGAGGGLPLAQLLQARPDGYTLAQMPVGVFRPVSPQAASHRRLDEDIVPVIQVSGYALGLSLSPDSPLMDWRQLGDWARTWLGELFYGPGSPPLTLELIADRLGQQLRQKLDEGMASLSGSVLQPSQASAVQARSSGPPARHSLGLDLIQNEPLGIVAPRGTPPAVVRRLHDAFQAAMAQPNFRQALAPASAVG